MIYKIKRWLSNPAENLWVQPTLGAIFALVFSLVASLGSYFLDEEHIPTISSEMLNDLLNILASSMLAVTTFSLSIMVSALATTASSASPRARLLIVADSNTRIAITSFISAFIYAIIAKIALGVQYYGATGRLVLFISTLLVLMYLIVTLIRWVQTLSQIGSLGDTIGKIEAIATQNMAHYRAAPNLNLATTAPNTPIFCQISSDKTGYIGHLELSMLNKTALKHGLYLHIHHRIGDFIEPKTVLATAYLFNEHNLSAADIDTIKDDIQSCIDIQANRSYNNDPRFALIVLSEVGQKAMSAAVNDPASTVITLDAMTRVLVDTKPTDSKMEVFERLSIAPLDIKDFIYPIFMPIAKDAYDDLDTSVYLLNCLGVIIRHAPERQLKTAAATLAKCVYTRTYDTLSYLPDKKELLEAYERIFYEASDLSSSP